MEKTANKISYLDGIRGIAAFIVFLHHFLIVFYVGYYTFDMQSTHLNGWDVRYGQSLLSVFSNGNFCVYVFFVLSGFVISRKYFFTNEVNDLISGAQRRFVRLYIPVAVTLLVAWCLVATNSFNSDAVAKITGSSLLWGSPVVVGAFYKLIQCLAYKTMLLGDSSFDTTLWTISLELYGSFFVFAFLGLTHNTKNRFSILVFLLLFTIVNDIIFLASFVFGIGLNFVEQHGSLKNKNLTNAFAIVLFITSLGFGSFPSTGMVRGTFYAKLSDWPTVFPWFHPVGAFLLVLSCVLSPVLQRMFSIRFFRFLGYVSFSLYLLHPLIIYAVGCPLFLNLYGSLDYNKTVGVVFLCCASVSLLVSWVMAKYVDAAGVKAAKYIYERWIKRKQGIELTE